MVIVAAIAVVANPGDGEGDTAVLASPSPTARFTQQPSAQTPTLPADNPFANFRIEPADDSPEFFSGDLSSLPRELGVYYLDVVTATVEGWHVPGQDPYQSMSFVLSPDNRLTVINEARLLADRQTETVYRWSGDVQVVMTSGTPSGENPRPQEQQLASAGNRVLFQYSEPDADDWFAVVDLEPEPRVVATFRAEGVSGIFSLDGSRAAVFGATLGFVDLASGAVESVPQPIQPELGSKTVVTLRNTMGGDGLLLTATPFSGDDVEGLWRHYTWDGVLLAEGARTIHPSPDGGLAWTFDGGPLPVSNAIDLTNGETLFRVVGATARQSYPLLLVPPRGAVRSWAAVIGGDIRDLSIEGYPPSSMYPAPGADVLFAGFDLDLSLSVFDSQGSVIVAYSPDPSAGVLGVSRSIPPWGDTNSEVRFAVGPRGSDDCCFTYSLIQPAIEEPPFSDPPVVGLHEDAAGEPLYDMPGGRVVGEIAPPLAVGVQMAETLLSEPSDPVNSLHCDFLARHANFGSECRGSFAGLWLLVTSANGQGWLLVQVNPVGH